MLFFRCRDCWPCYLGRHPWGWRLPCTEGEKPTSGVQPHRGGGGTPLRLPQWRRLGLPPRQRRGGGSPLCLSQRHKGGSSPLQRVRGGYPPCVSLEEWGRRPTSPSCRGVAALLFYGSYRQFFFSNVTLHQKHFSIFTSSKTLFKT